MNAAKRLEIFRRLHEDNPEPKTELMPYHAASQNRLPNRGARA